MLISVLPQDLGGFNLREAHIRLSIPDENDLSVEYLAKGGYPCRISGDRETVEEELRRQGYSV